MPPTDDDRRGYDESEGQEIGKEFLCTYMTQYVSEVVVEKNYVGSIESSPVEIETNQDGINSSKNIMQFWLPSQFPQD